ncbi:MAG: DUF1189 family protein [bacterium]|nr:DUF1189 family protein [bacterium]
MSTDPSYSPSLLKSLLLSCTDADFYRRIVQVSFWRSVSFLFLLSLLFAFISVFSVSFVFRSVNLTPEFLNELYRETTPVFSGSYRDSQLTVAPSSWKFFIGLNSSGQLISDNKRSSSTLLPVYFNFSDFGTEDATHRAQEAGLYFFRDGLMFTDGEQSLTRQYSDLEMQLPENFDKASLEGFITQRSPALIDWLTDLATIMMPIMSFLYIFFGAIVLGFFFSFFGLLIFFFIGKTAPYRYFYQLSFSCLCPTLLVGVVTLVLGIWVPILPLLVYTAYYFYGLRVSEG